MGALGTHTRNKGGRGRYAKLPESYLGNVSAH